MLRIRTFGGLSVHRGDERVLGAAAQPRRMAVLAMVARAGTRGISRDKLQATLWPDVAEEQGRHALKQAVYALRRDTAVGELFVGTRDLCLNPDEVWCDVAEFDELLRREQFDRAAALYTGTFLDGLRLSTVPEFEQWMEEERRDLVRALATALDRLSRSARTRGDVAAAAQWQRRLVALEPLNARATTQLMELLLASGDRAGALQQARIYESLMAQQLDLPPEPGVIELARQIRAGSVVVPPRPPRPPVAPSTPAESLRAPEPMSASPARAPIPQPPSELSVAVLPFASISADVETGIFGEGLTEELISALGQRHELRVSGRIPAALSVDGAPDLPAIGARFGVATVLQGSVRREGKDTRVTARLLRVRDGVILWTDRYDRRVDNTLALQDELARAIADAVERELRGAAGLPRAPTARERADALYALGMRAWSPEGAGLGQGIEQFRQAVAIDPLHSRAHAALAESYTQLAFYGFLPAARAATLATAAAQEAARLAPDMAESHLARGTCLLWVDRDFDAGTGELERALELDPTLVVAQARLAFVRLCHHGPVDAGRELAHRAATVVGATGLSRVMYGQQLLAAGRYDEAIDALHAAIDIEAPSFLAYHWLSAAYVQKGMAAEGVAAAVAEASLSNRHPWSLASLIVACAAAGQRRRAETLLATLRGSAAAGYVQSSVLGLAHAALGDPDTGMTFLERAVDERDPSMMMLKAFPMFSGFREHARFPALLRRAGWRDAAEALATR